jgi:hypothetical protein
MHGPINVKSPNNTSIWQIRFNSAFKGLSNSLGGTVIWEIWLGGVAFAYIFAGKYVDEIVLHI